MILTCPNCSTRFKFPKEGLGKTGIKVRCTECLEVWRQNPLEEDEERVFEDKAGVKDVAEATDEIIITDTKAEGDGLEIAEGEKAAQDSVDDLFESIEAPDPSEIEPEKTAEDNKEEEESESASEETEEEDKEGQGGESEEDEDILEFREKEDTDSKDSSEEGTDRSVREKIPDKRAVSFGAAGAVFLLSLIIMIVIRSPFMQNYPSMHGFYGLFGMGMNLPGEDLIFDQITSNITKNELHIEGKIVNLSSDIRDVPLIEASIRDKEHHSKEIWYILPPKDALGGEEELHFTSVYHVEKNLTDSFKIENDIHFRFVLKKPDMEMRSRAQQGEEGSEHNEALHKKEEPEEDHHSKTDEASGGNTRALH